MERRAEADLAVVAVLDKARRLMAEVGRGERQLEDPIAAVRGDALAIVGDAGQVQVLEVGPAVAGERPGEAHATPAIEIAGVGDR